MAFAMVSVLAVSALCAVIPSDSDAASGYSFTDGTGTEYTFEKAPEHIATVGAGITATAIQIGALDKIVVCDKYSKTYDYDVFKDLQKNIADGKVRANGSAYTSGHSDLKADLVYMADELKKFDKEKDIVILTGSFSTLSALVSDLKDAGFKNVLQWQDIKDYGDLIGFVTNVSIAINGEKTDYVDQMENLSKYIDSHLEGVTKRNAVYVTYSSGDYKVGNTGSLANSMILAAGGDSVSIDDSKKATYGDKNTLAKFVTDNPGIVIFMDNSVASDQSRVNEIGAMSSDQTKVALQPLWNNYSIASMDGVWTMACAMYPDIFSGDVPTVESDEEDNFLLYACAGIAFVAIIGVVAFIFMRK